MINNRQNGRRRGRGGGQRPGGGGGGQGQRDSGNRIDSRARGNASQLYEKYKNMARDAQMSGDRVNTEYYLQFADHYFRVLSDQRGRFEEQGQRRAREDFDQFDDGDDFGDEGDPVRNDEQVRANEAEAPRRDRSYGDRQRPDRQQGERQDGERIHAERQHGDRQRDDRRGPSAGQGEERAPRAPREDRRPARVVPAANDIEEAAPAPAPAVASDAEPVAAEPRRRGRPRKVREEIATPPVSDDVDGGVVAFEAERLPPSIAPVSTPEESAEEAPKPRRRRVRVAGDVTPAE